LNDRIPNVPQSAAGLYEIDLLDYFDDLLRFRARDKNHNSFCRPEAPAQEIDEGTNNNYNYNYTATQSFNNSTLPPPPRSSFRDLDIADADASIVEITNLKENSVRERLSLVGGVEVGGRSRRSVPVDLRSLTNDSSTDSSPGTLVREYDAKPFLDLPKDKRRKNSGIRSKSRLPPFPGNAYGSAQSKAAAAGGRSSSFGRELASTSEGVLGDDVEVLANRSTNQGLGKLQDDLDPSSAFISPDGRTAYPSRASYILQTLTAEEAKYVIALELGYKVFQCGLLPMHLLELVAVDELSSLHAAEFRSSAGASGGRKPALGKSTFSRMRIKDILHPEARGGGAGAMGGSIMSGTNNLEGTHNSLYHGEEQARVDRMLGSHQLYQAGLRKNGPGTGRELLPAEGVHRMPAALHRTSMTRSQHHQSPPSNPPGRTLASSAGSLHKTLEFSDFAGNISRFSELLEYARATRWNVIGKMGLPRAGILESTDDAYAGLFSEGVRAELVDRPARGETATASPHRSQLLVYVGPSEFDWTKQQGGFVQHGGGAQHHHVGSARDFTGDVRNHKTWRFELGDEASTRYSLRMLEFLSRHGSSGGRLEGGSGPICGKTLMREEERDEVVFSDDEESGDEEVIRDPSGQVEVGTMTYLGALKREKAARNGPAKRKNRNNRAGKIVTRPVTALEVVCFVGASKYHLPAEKNSNAATKQLLSPSGVRSLHHARELVHAMSSHELNATDRKGNSLMLRAYQQLYHFPKRFEVVAQAVLEQCPRFQLLHGCDSEEGKTLLHICVQQRWGEAVVRLLSGRPGNDKWRMETNYVSRRAANFFTNSNFLNSTSHATQIPRPDAHDRKGNSCLFDAVDANDGRMLALLLKFCLESPEKMHGWRTIATSKPPPPVEVDTVRSREDQSEVSSVDVAGNPDRHFHLRKLPAGREYVGEASVYNKEKGGSRSYGEQQQIEFPLLEHASRGGHSILMHAIYKRREGVVLKILTELCLLIKRCSINDWSTDSARGNSSNSLVSGKEHSRYSPEYIPLASPAFGGGDPVYGRIPPVGGPETYNGEGGSVKWPQAGVGGKYFGGNRSKRGAEVLHMAPPVGGQQPGIGRTATGGGFSQQHAPFVSQQQSHQAGDHHPTNSDPRVTEDFCELVIHPQNTDPAVYRKLLFDLVNFRDQDGRTLLSAACSMGLVRVVEVLLGELDEARCDSRNVGGMPVSTKIAPTTSTTTTRSTLTSLLRPCGFLFTDDNVNAVDLFGKNALHYAIARREYEICNLLFFSRRFRAYNDPEIARFFAERHHRDIVPLIPRLLANLEKRWHIQNEAASRGRTRNIGGAALEVAGSTEDVVGRFAQQDFFRREDGQGSRRRDPGDFEESGREHETTTSSAAGDLFPQPHPEKTSSSRIPEVLDPEPARPRPYDEIVAEDSDAYFEELRRPARSPMTKRERERAAAMKKGGGVGGKRRPEPLESYVADEEIEQFVRSFSDHFGVGNVVEDHDMDIPISPPISPIAQMDTERALQAGAGNRGNKLPKGGSNAAANVKKKTARGQKRGVPSADNSYRAYEQIPLTVRAVPAQDEILVENGPDEILEPEKPSFDEEEEAGDRFDDRVLPPPDLAELKDLPGNNSSSPSLTISPAVTHATSRRSGAGGTGADHSANVTTSSSSLPVSFTETASGGTRTNAFAEVIQEQAEVLIQEEAEGTMKQQNNNAGVGRARNLVISTSDRPSPLTGEEQTSPLRNRSDSVEFGKDLSQKWSDRLNSSPSRNITEKYRDFKISRPADQDLSDLRGAGAAGSKSRGMTAAEAYNYAHGSGSFAVSEGQHRREVCCPSENKTAHLLLLDDEEDDYANDRESFARATRHPPKRNSKTSNCRDNCSAGRDVLVRRHHRRRAGAGSGQNGDKNRQLLTYAKTALSPLPQSPDAANHLPGFPPAALTSPFKRGGARDCMPGGWHEGMHCAEDTLFSETESGCNGLRNEGAPASGIEPLFFCEGTHESGDFQEQQKRPEDSRVTRNLHDITYIEGSHRANQSLPLESPMARLQRYSDNYHPNHDPYGPYGRSPPFPSPDMPLYNSNRNYYLDSMRLNHATDEVVQNVQKERKKLLGDKFADHGWTPHYGHFRKAHKSLDVKIARSVEDYDEVYRIDHAGDVVEKKSYFNYDRSREEGELVVRRGDYRDTGGEEPLISGYSYYDEVLDLDMQLHSGEVRAGRAGRRKEKINSEVENEKEEKHHLVIADDPGLNFDALKTNEEFIPDDQRLPDMLRGGSLRKLVGGGGGRASASARLKTKPAAAREGDDNELAPPAKTSGAEVNGYDERVTFGSTFNKSHSSTSRIEETRGNKNDTTTTSSTSLAQHDELLPPQHINVFHASVAGYQYLGKKDGREYYLSAVNDGGDYILAASTKPTDCDAYGNRLTNATEIAKSVRYQPPPSSRRCAGAASADRTEKTYLLKAHLQSAGYEGRRYLAKVREEESQSASPQHPTRKPMHAPSTRSMHAPGGDPGVEDPDALIRSQAGGEGPSVGVAVRNSLMIRGVAGGGGGGGGERAAGGAVKTRIQLSPQDDIKQLLAENQQHIDRCFDILQHPERYVTMPTEEEIAEAKAKQLRAKQEMAVGKDPFARPNRGGRRRRNGKGGRKEGPLFGGEEEEQENAFYLSDGDQHQEVSKTRGPKSLLMNDLSVEDPMLEGILFGGSMEGKSDVMQKSRHTKIAANVKYWQYYEPPISASLHFEKHPETGRPVPILPFSKRPDRIRKKDSVLSKDGVDVKKADSCTIVSSGEVDHDGLRRAMLGSSGAGANPSPAAREDQYEPERVGSMLASNTSPSYDFWNMHRYALKHSATMEDVHAVEQRLRKKQETVNLKKEREMWDARLQEAVQKRNAKLSESRDLVVGAKDGAKGETSFGVVPSGTNPDVVTMGGSSALDLRAEQPEKHRLTENNLQKTFGEDKSTARAQKDLATEAAGAKQTEITTLARNMAKLQHRIGKASPYFREEVGSPKGLTNKSLSAVSAAKLARAATLRDLQEKAAPEEVKPVPVRHKATLVLAGKVLSSGQPLLVMK